MATHYIQIVDSKQLSDGQLALLAECCGCETTRSWLTLAASVVIDDAQYQQSINFHCNRVGLQHESMLQALAKVQTVLGTSTTITVAAPAPAQPVSTPDPAPSTPSAPTSPDPGGQSPA
jgi:hypothetical protein